MVHTVGIYGINGNVGKPTLKLLIKAAEEGTINLVAFHRTGSKPTDVTLGKNAEFRELNTEDSEDKKEAAFKGVNVFISTVGAAGQAAESALVDALSKSQDLVAYIPPVYSITWDEDDEKNPDFKPIMDVIHGMVHKAKAQGVATSIVYIGAFDFYLLQYGFLGAPISANVVQGSEGQLKNGVPITAISHLAQGLTKIVTSDPQDIKNKDFSIVTFMPTGQELLDLYSKINGKPAQLKDYTPADREAALKDAANYGPIKVGYWDRWEKGSYAYEKDGRVAVKEYDGPSLEEIARSLV